MELFLLQNDLAQRYFLKNFGRFKKDTPPNNSNYVS